MTQDERDSNAQGWIKRHRRALCLMRLAKAAAWVSLALIAMAAIAYLIYAAKS